ncbi:tryptophan 2,3-dioxygenase [Cupriavidus pauculus]|uniref:tryptophan 2,3-dioxygenase n=1 Tax=Cupriavidus pauculus TaxID=82633 RepID=UPI001EE19B49|nr:tryptophan 2,3-dioxygenase family protein [Cupriavidus pauculus]GJG94866.1 tryptophan 2,3-dioxygenase [Cupriavidus pauculus]
MSNAIATENAGPQPGITPAGQTPYSAWMRTDVLHTLQHPVSDHPGEHAWITSVQVSELYWMLMIREIQTAQQQLRSHDLAEVCRTLRRVVAHHEPLNATWKSIAWMTPTDLLSILSRAVAKYGKDTALQGWTYRQMVYLLGIRQPEHLQHFTPQPERHQQLSQVLEQPSLYDDVLAYLHHAGFAVPAAVSERDYRQPYTPDKTVEQAWRDIYAEPGKHAELYLLGETLADIVEGFSAWKHLHLMATRRTFGHRAAYFGTEGIAWLLPTMEELPFPELWTARSFIGDPPAAVCPHMHKQERSA